MADYTNTWYVNAGNQSTTGYYAVAKRQPSAAVVAGQIVRQFSTPAVNSERCFVCITAGVTTAATDAPWVLGRGAKTNDGTATWQECTGAAAVNGDAVNTLTWAQAKAAIFQLPLGIIIKRNNGASYQINQIATGVSGATEPAFSDTAGVVTADGTASWVSLGPVGNFAGGGAPFARLASAVGLGAGDTVYVGDNHAESQSTGIMWGPTGQYSATMGSKILCHNHTGPYPPVALATGAMVSITGASQNFVYNLFGTLYIYGIAFRVGVGVNTSFSNIVISPNAGSYLYFDNCSFWLMCTTPGNSSAIQVGGTDVLQANVVFNNCKVSFAGSSNCIAPADGLFVWQNTGQVLIPGSAVPDALFSFGSVALGSRTDVVLEAIDLSQIIGLWRFNLDNLTATMVVKDCKLNAAWTVIRQPTVPGIIVQLARSGSDVAGRYQSSRYTCDGTETTETAITRVGGAVDPAGQPQSRRIETTANPQWLRPFQAEPYAIWNSAVGADITLTVHGTVHDALPNNDDIWLELEYLGSSSSPIGTTVNTTKADVFAANAPGLTDSSRWNGGGGGAGWSPFKLTAVLSAPPPGLPGYIHVRVRAAKPNTTFFIDPVVVLS